MREPTARLQDRLAAAMRLQDGIVWSLADLGGRAIVLGLLYFGLLALAAWAGGAIVLSGGWLDADQALFRALNGLSLGPLTALLFAVLNEPAPNYFGIMVLILGYCWWRKRPLLPLAALAIALALAFGATATKTMHEAGGGGRERPFLAISEARTPIAGCAGPSLVAMRTAEGPTATCSGAEGDQSAAEALGAALVGGEADATVESAPDAAAGAPLAGRDWRDVWVDFATFPSGHMREVAALCLLLAFFWPRAWPYALGYTVVMAFSRVHLGAHYPTDVLAGTIVGLWAGGAALLIVDLIRRAIGYLARVPAVREAWDWVFAPRLEGRPDQDPLGARGLRIGAYLVALNLALIALGWALTSVGAGHLYSALGSMDVWAFWQVAGRFEPSLAQSVYLLFGRFGLVYGVLLGAVLLVAARRGRPALMWTLVTIVVAAAVAFELRGLASLWFERAAPDARVEPSPLPPEWRDAWGVVSSFPSLHALLTAALAGVVAGLWPRGAIAAQLLAAGAALTAVYFGAAWLTDALAGYLLGNLAAMLARYVAQQFMAPAATAATGSTVAAQGSVPLPQRTPSPGPAALRGDR